MAETKDAIEASRKAKGEKPQKAQLQEPKFWTKYSPHHEFSLSTVTSVCGHILVLGVVGLVLAGYIGGGNSKPSVPVEAIAIAGGGGDPDGVGDGPGRGIKAASKEAVSQEQPKTPIITGPTAKTTPLEAAAVKTPTITDDPKSQRYVSETDSALANAKLSDASKELDKALSGILAGKGKGGPGSGGGKGKGVGTGEGDLSGPGTGSISKREQRKNRWIMIFSTRSGQDYARQLQDLGAILAVRTNSPTDFMVYTDLSRRPVRGEITDITNINRIFWIDDNPQSVRSVSEVLGISPIPPQLVAFFPIELEQELLQKELAHFRGGNEDDIYETYFKVELRGGKYTPIVRNVVRKGGAARR